MAERQPLVVKRDQLEKLIEALRAQEFEVIGPTIRDGAITLGHLESVNYDPCISCATHFLKLRIEREEEAELET